MGNHAPDPPAPRPRPRSLRREPPDARARAGRPRREPIGLARPAGRAPPRERPPALLRRGERRGLLVLRRQAAHLPVHAGRRPLRPAVRDERGRLRRPPGLEREGADHLRVLLPGRGADPLRLDPRGGRRLPAPARHEPGLRLAALRLPDLHGPARRVGRAGAGAGARLLHGRGHRLEGRLDRLHLHPGRRPRPLQDAARRIGAHPPHQRTRLRRGSLLLGRREADRLPGQPPGPGPRSTTTGRCSPGRWSARASSRS